MDHNEVGLAKIASDFAQAWQSGQWPVLSDFLSRVSDDLRSSLLQQLLPLDAKHRQQAGEVVSVDDYRQICESVSLDPEVCLSNVINPAQANPPDSERTSVHAPQLDVTGDYSAPEPASDGSLEFVVKQGPAQDTQNTQDQGDPRPEIARIGRYCIEKVLGKGGFGLVYLAQDEQLDRLVAIKVPHAKLISKPEDAEAYLAEARTVANLDHPGIVPVHDVGSTEDWPCYVVSKYIEGTDLAAKLKQQRTPYREAAELVAIVAAALHYAHKQGLVHRDVKPGNILIGKDGKALRRGLRTRPARRERWQGAEVRRDSGVHES